MEPLLNKVVKFHREIHSGKILFICCVEEEDITSFRGQFFEWFNNEDYPFYYKSGLFKKELYTDFKDGTLLWSLWMMKYGVINERS